MPEPKSERSPRSFPLVTQLSTFPAQFRPTVSLHCHGNHDEYYECNHEHLSTNQVLHTRRRTPKYFYTYTSSAGFMTYVILREPRTDETLRKRRTCFRIKYKPEALLSVQLDTGVHLESTLRTWDVPKNEKYQSMFYSAGSLSVY